MCQVTPHARRYRVYKNSRMTHPIIDYCVHIIFICARLMNNLGYSKFTNPNRLLKLLLMHRGNHWDHFLWYFHCLAQGLPCIWFLESISSNTECRWSHLDQKNHLQGLHDISNIWYFGHHVTRDSQVILKIWLSIHKIFLVS